MPQEHVASVPAIALAGYEIAASAGESIQHLTGQRSIEHSFEEAS